MLFMLFAYLISLPVYHQHRTATTPSLPVSALLTPSGIQHATLWKPPNRYPSHPALNHHGSPTSHSGVTVPLLDYINVSNYRGKEEKGRQIFWKYSQMSIRVLAYVRLLNKWIFLSLHLDRLTFSAAIMLCVIKTMRYNNSHAIKSICLSNTIFKNHIHKVVQLTLLIPVIFITLKRKTYAHWQSLPISPSLQPLTTTNRLPIHYVSTYSGHFI